MVNKIPIIIIDDGVNNELYDIGNLRIDMEVTNDLEVKKRTDSKDCSYHGSTCSAIIKKYLPNVELGSIKVLNNYKGTPYQLVKAIKWCVTNNIKLVNLSLGSVSFRDFKLLHSCMEYAYKKGLIIIASYNNEEIYTSPASFDKVIGVKCDKSNSLKNNEYIYNERSLDGIEVIANSKHELIDNYGGSYITPNCNSYATPVITSLVYKLIEKQEDITLDEIKVYLKENAVNNENINYNLNLINSYYKKEKKENVPLIFLYDFTEQQGASFLKVFCELFRKNGYYAMGIIDSQLKSSKHEGLVSLKEYYGDVKFVDGSIIKDIYNTFNCDIILNCIEGAKHLSEIDDHLNFYNALEIDINIFIISDFTIEIENVIKNNIERNILILSCVKNNRISKDKIYKVFYDPCQLYRYVMQVLI